MSTGQLLLNALLHFATFAVVYVAVFYLASRANRLLASELRRERVLRRRDELRHERERKALIDAMQRASNKSEVFNRPAPPKPSSVQPVAFGPTMSAGRQAAKAKEAEIVEKAVAAKASNNGSHPALPVIPDSE